jgi:hypothetical protein
MATKVLTKDPTEAELEAKIRAALCKVFPFTLESRPGAIDTVKLHI